MTTDHSFDSFVPAAVQRAQSPLGERWLAGVIGPPRSGKGVFTAIMAADLWHRRGMRVVHLGNLPFGEQVNIEDLADQDPESLEETLFVVDEGMQSMGSAASRSAFGQLVQNNLVQGGHRGLSVIFTATDEAGFMRAIYELAQTVVWIRSYIHKPWTSSRWLMAQRKSGRTVKDNRCAAFFPNSDWHWQHNVGAPLQSCLDADEKVTIGFEMVAQKGSRLQRGRHKVFGRVNCAQRFYPLNSTQHFIDARDRYMLTADRLREQTFDAKLDAFGVYLNAIATRYPELPLAPIVQGAVNYGIDMTTTEVQRSLRYLGVERGRSGGTTKTSYKLFEWSRIHGPQYGSLQDEEA